MSKYNYKCSRYNNHSTARRNCCEEQEQLMLKYSSLADSIPWWNIFRRSERLEYIQKIKDIFKENANACGWDFTYNMDPKRIPNVK